MKDRVPTHAGRVQLVPVQGETNIYDMTRADDPTQEGTPLNKANILPDATAALLGLTGDPALKDALNALGAIQIQTGDYTGDGSYGVNNKNTLTTPHMTPLFAIISNEGSWGVISFQSGKVYTQMTQIGTATATLGSCEWYSQTNSSYQFNQANVTYNYIILGAGGVE